MQKVVTLEINKREIQCLIYKEIVIIKVHTNSNLKFIKIFINHKGVTSLKLASDFK